MPNPSQLPTLPTFSSPAAFSGLDLLAVAAASANGGPGAPPPGQVAATLSAMGPYNPAASLPPRIAKKVLDLEFVEMSELRGDIWLEDGGPSDQTQSSRRATTKPPVTDIRVWLEGYARMAALLVTRFPQKGPELWAYQSTIVKAAHNYEGCNWVAYDRQFRRDMLARKDLNWSVPNAQLYSEAFTGRAKCIPRCPHCLGDDHSGPACPLNPSPVVVNWVTEPRPLLPPTAAPMLSQGQARAGAGRQEVCRNFNEGRCRFTRCRYLHCCSACFGPHPAGSCPQGPAPQGMELLARGRGTPRGRQGGFHPYAPARR